MFSATAKLPRLIPKSVTSFQPFSHRSKNGDFAEYSVDTMKHFHPSAFSAFVLNIWHDRPSIAVMSELVVKVLACS